MNQTFSRTAPDQGSSRVEIAEIRKKVELYLNVNRYDAAEKLLKATLADYGPLANIHNLLGLTYHKQSRFAEALKDFNKALQINPNYIEAALNLTATLCDLSRYDEAQAVFANLQVLINPKKKQPELILGRIANQHAQNGRAYEESAMLTEAIQEYRKALALYPPMPDVKLALAKAYVRVGQQDKARQEFEDLIKLTPHQTEAHTWLGILYYKLGRKDEAKRLWEKAQQSNPNDLAARAYLKLSREWTAESKMPPA